MVEVELTAATRSRLENRGRLVVTARIRADDHPGKKDVRVKLKVDE